MHQMPARHPRKDRDHNANAVKRFFDARTTGKALHVEEPARSIHQLLVVGDQHGLALGVGPVSHPGVLVKRVPLGRRGPRHLSIAICGHYGVLRVHGEVEAATNPEEAAFGHWWKLRTMLKYCLKLISEVAAGGATKLYNVVQFHLSILYASKIFDTGTFQDIPRHFSTSPAWPASLARFLRMIWGFIWSWWLAGKECPGTTKTQRPLRD